MHYQCHLCYLWPVFYQRPPPPPPSPPPEKPPPDEKPLPPEPPGVAAIAPERLVEKLRMLSAK
jgi:hypothetical protein